MNISLTPKQEKYIADQIAQGDFQNASELVRDALRMHQFYRQKMIEDLRAAIQKGWDAPESTRSMDDLFEEAVAGLKE